MTRRHIPQSRGRALRIAALLVLLTAPLAGLASLLGGLNGVLLALVGGLTLVFVQRQLAGLSRQAGRELSSSSRITKLVASLAMKAGLAPPRVWVITHSQPNAWAIGLAPDRSAIIVTSGLLKTLTLEELAGVFAHELAHIRNRDTLVMTVVGAVALTTIGAIGILALLCCALSRRQGLGVYIAAAAASLTTVLIAFAFGREREYEADRLGAAICGHPEWLIAALRKIGRVPIRKGSGPLLAGSFPALTFVQAKAGNAGGWFSTHPPISARIARLAKGAAPMNASGIGRHGREWALCITPIWTGVTAGAKPTRVFPLMRCVSLFLSTDRFAFSLFRCLGKFSPSA